MSENFFATRHSIKPKNGIDPESEIYQGISEKGVDLARERAKDILEIVKNEPEGTVMFLAGSSEIPRAKNAAKIYGEEIDKILSENEDKEISVISKKNIEDISKTENSFGDKPGYTQIANGIGEEIKANPNQKYIIDFPMYIKEYAFNNQRWADKDGNQTEYVTKLLAKYNNNVEDCLRDWIKNEGKLDDLCGPNPTDMAKEQLEGIKRLTEFSSRFLEAGRNLLIGSVGHSWSLDALGVYLTNNGKVDIEGYENLGGKMIGETQIMRVGKNKDEKKSLFYGGKEYDLE